MATKAFTDKSGNRKGFVSREDRDGRTRYGVGIDNVGSPYRGAYDGEINTPLGTLDYGYDGDTVYGGYTPPAVKQQTLDHPLNQYRSTYLDNVMGMYPGVYTQTTPARGTEYGFEVEGLPVTGNGWQDYNTPFGTLHAGLSDDAVGGASLSPNAQTQYYIQALANLLSRGR